MGKWVASFILLLQFFLYGLKVLARDKEDFFNNFLLDEPVDEVQCDQMQLEVSFLDSTMTLDNYPRLNGKWVSQECEVRPGFEFLLRSYFFTKSNGFRLIQHFYEDESCILPLYTVVARGELILKESSWITPGGTECEYLLNRVILIPHTTEATKKLSNEIKGKCPERKNKIWKPHREYIIYSLKDSPQIALESDRKRRKYRRYKRKKIYRDIDCLLALRIEFNELMLIRTQTRILEKDKKSRELLLGDIHSRNEARFTYKPTAFQVPLLKSDQALNCDNCEIIAKSTERAPPRLHSKPQLPPLPHGQWVSQRCEVRPFGMFLLRKLSFDSRDRTWNGVYKFHADPFCLESAFAILASGKYALDSVQHKKILERKKGVHFDFHIEDASLILYDSTLRDTFNTETNCGIGDWYVGVPKDLSPTSGCSILGIVLPTIEYELIKLEIDNKGTPLLFMGQPDTDNKKRNYKERPTSYQAPLAQCSVFPLQTASNHLEPVYYARKTVRSSASKMSPLFCLICSPSLPLYSYLFRKIVQF